MQRLASMGLSLALLLTAGGPVSAGDGVELIRYMGRLQYMAHKTGLAIDARNRPLADFYLHEIEEVVEKLETVEEYDGYAIASLVKSILVPSVEGLEASLKAGDWAGTDAGFDGLVQSCNECHATTDHGYLAIRRNRDNPYMQTFAAP